jgi:hypothetical protein
MELQNVTGITSQTQCRTNRLRKLPGISINITAEQLVDDVDSAPIKC